MTQVQVPGRGPRLMQRLTETHFLLVKAEVGEMTPEDARNIWGQIEAYFVGVCAKASGRKRDAEWVSLVQKMSLIKRKAEEAGA